jgi:hypothetical protein
MPAMSSRFKYIEDPGHFALIRVPPNSKPPADAIACGSLAAVTERVLSSKARADALALVARADEAAEQEREREQREQEIFAEGVRALRDGILKLSHRLDALVQSRDARRRLDAASEATKQMLELPQDRPALDLADATPSPSGELHALEPKDPAEHQPVTGDQGDLTRELERGAPPGLGTEPTIEGPQSPQQPQPIALEE